MPMSADLPPLPGTYILLLELIEDRAVPIGKLGTFAVRRGWYTYVGSAFGSGGLRGRLTHHLTPPARPHWHIDHLRAAATVREVWTVANPTPVEHVWAERLLALPGAAVPIPRFGASDCRCAAHLFYFAERPLLAAFQALNPEISLTAWRP